MTGSAAAGVDCAGVVLLLVRGCSSCCRCYAMARLQHHAMPGTGGRSGAAWTSADARTPTMYRGDHHLAAAGGADRGRCMVVLLVPTMIWVRLRAPWASRLVEFLCLLPLTIPRPGRSWSGSRNVYAVGRTTSSATRRSRWPSSYVVLVLPYAYRAIDAALSGHRPADPGRGRPLPGRRLGHRRSCASWCPNIWPGILAGVVHLGGPGAGGVHRLLAAPATDTLPVVIVLLGKSDAPDVDGGGSLASILFVRLPSCWWRCRSVDRRRHTSEGNSDVRGSQPS